MAVVVVLVEMARGGVWGVLCGVGGGVGGGGGGGGYGGDGGGGGGVSGMRWWWWVVRSLLVCVVIVVGGWAWVRVVKCGRCGRGGCVVISGKW